jgi:hypothetical protein
MHIDLSWLKQLLLIFVFLAFMGYMLAIGLIMLFSPDLWFRMPYNLALRGAMRRDNSSNLQVRFMGFVLTFTILVMAGGFSYTKATG